FCFDFRCACDAPVEISQQWYQSQAKAARRRGGHPRPAPIQGRPPTARLAARGRPATAKALCRGSHQQVRLPTGMAGACRGGAYGRRQCPRPGLSPARMAAGKSGHQQGQRPHKVASPAREVPLEGSSACRRGGCPRRRRAALPSAQGSSDDGDADGGKRARASF
ncbi:hypothetical protein BHE74_00049260, partial [Ensete ventricosum]